MILASQVWEEELLLLPSLLLELGRLTVTSHRHSSLLPGGASSFFLLPLVLDLPGLDLFLVELRPGFSASLRIIGVFHRLEDAVKTLKSDS